MTDHITNEEAFTEWERRARSVRTIAAISLLDHLDRLSDRISDADLFDAAYEVWTEFIEGRSADQRITPLTDHELHQQVAVFTRAARFLTEAEVVNFARQAWGDTEIRATSDGRAVTWMPADDIIIISTTAVTCVYGGRTATGVTA